MPAPRPPPSDPEAAFLICEVTMPATTAVSPQSQIAAAVRLIHQYQHQPDCACSVWRDSADEGFCNPDHARWSHTCDKLIDMCRRGA